jgi:glucose/arabinose dehydrogenase
MPNTSRRTSTLAALALAAVACSPSVDSGTDGAGPTDAASPAIPTVAAAAPTPNAPPTSDPGTPAAPDLQAVNLAARPIVELDRPIAMAVRPGDDALYIAERSGRVVRVVDGSADATPVLDITAQTTQDSERGLLGLAFSPDGGTLYASYTDLSGDTQLDAYELNGTEARPDSRRNLLSVDQPFSNHNGGNVVTGPDGLLYLGLGDGGSGNDPRGNGQDPSTLLGGVLRIDPSPSGDAPYAVPADNPFVGNDGRDELWLYGLRNPWRFSFDAANDDVWIGDVGEGAVEEIDRLPFEEAGGTNLGWNVFEGTRRSTGAEAPDAVPPVFEYPHDGRCSVTGGYVYRGDDVAALHGAYVYGDFCDGVVRAIVVEDGAVAQQRAFDVSVPSLVSFGQDAQLELYALSLNGTVFRLTDG